MRWQHALPAKCVFAWAIIAMAATVCIIAGCGDSPKLAVNSPESVENNPDAKKPKSITPQTFAEIGKENLDSNWQRLHQKFFDATIQEPPGEQQRPPDLTFAGKKTAQLYLKIAGDKKNPGLWETIQFLTSEGKKIHYRARLVTDPGSMMMELYPESAPNHVRNFVALALVGYYDGLLFERSVQEEVESEPGKFLRYIEGGCPIGNGDGNYGSIGYWLKSEISKELQHIPGSVGATHGPELETAACKFYITLEKSPWIDGQFSIFGRITTGLDVAGKIFQEANPTSDAKAPTAVVIRRVEIETSVDDKQSWQSKPRN